MSSVEQVTGNTTLAELNRFLPDSPLYGDATVASGSHIGWLLSPHPYGLSPEQIATLTELGPCLFAFSKAIDHLYKSSLKDSDLYWLSQLFHKGKPESLLSYAQMNRFKHEVPLVIRPDLLVTENGFTLCEIDAVPGGIGFTGALHHAYQQAGFKLVGTPEGIPKAFLNMLIGNAGNKVPENPMIAVIVSDEAADYRREMAWLVNSIQSFYPNIVLLHPKQITLNQKELGFLDEVERFVSIHIIYRFFELFDLPNIPQIELIQYAVKKGLVYCTPPFKPHLEEKLVLALIHYSYLEDFWINQLGEKQFALLKQVIPEGWILDPAVVPPHARIVPELVFQNRHLRDFSRLGTLTQKQRELIIKPSGFSPLAWGSRGVKVGHDMPQTEWENALTEAFRSFETTPFLMQRFMHTKVEPYQYFHPQDGSVINAEGRTRLCPYYFVHNETTELTGILTTTCPRDKKIIHGMRDGVMRPAYQQV